MVLVFEFKIEEYFWICQTACTITGAQTSNHKTVCLPLQLCFESHDILYELNHNIILYPHDSIVFSSSALRRPDGKRSSSEVSNNKRYSRINELSM